MALCPRLAAVPLVTLLALSPPAARAEVASSAVRPAVFANAGWYPDTKAALVAMMDELEKHAPRMTLEGHVAGIIGPHAGMAYSGRAAAAVYRLLQGRRYKRVVVVAPSHRQPFSGIGAAPFEAYETPLGRIPVDVDACRRLRTHELFSDQRDAHMVEHSLEMQLPFLQRYLNAPWQLVPLVVGSLQDDDYPKAADALRPLIDDETLLVASSDFTHQGARFGYVPFRSDRRRMIRRLDLFAFSALQMGDRPGFLEACSRHKITICGRQPIGLLTELLAGQATPLKMDYYTSSDVTASRGPGGQTALTFAEGPEDRYESSVSYLSAAWIRPPRLSGADKKRLIQLCHDRLREIVHDPSKAGRLTIPQDTSPALRTVAGAFVTLRLKGKLRGCIGTIVPTRPLVEDVLDHVADSAFNDPRFPGVTVKELADLTVQISVLGAMRRETDLDRIEVGKHGLVIRAGQSSGVFLPQVATEQGWNREQFLEGVCRKARLPRDTYKKGAAIYVFTARVFGDQGGEATQ